MYEGHMCARGSIDAKGQMLVAKNYLLRGTVIEGSRRAKHVSSSHKNCKILSAEEL